MKQPLLTTKAKVETYLQIAIGYSVQEFERFIREAQEFDLKPLLCEDFYFELVSKKTDPEFVKIIEGQEYDFEGKTYYHEGLEAVLAYFVYARFVLKSNVVSATHGMVHKTTPNSEPLGHTEKKDIYHTCRQDANTLFEAVVKYMDRKEIDYKDCLGCGETKEDIVIRAPKW